MWWTEWKSSYVESLDFAERGVNPDEQIACLSGFKNYELQNSLCFSCYVGSLSLFLIA